MTRKRPLSSMMRGDQQACGGAGSAELGSSSCQSLETTSQCTRSRDVSTCMTGVVSVLLLIR
jgi:hypothetical protein